MSRNSIEVSESDIRYGLHYAFIPDRAKPVLMDHLTGREIDSILLISTDEDKERRYSRAAVMASCRLVHALTRRNPDSSFEEIHAEISRILTTGRFPHALKDITRAVKPE